MGPERPDNALELARLNSGLSGQELWLRYFGLGGMTEPLQLEAVLHGALTTTAHDHDQIAHALNERFTELGRNHPVPYLTAPEDDDTLGGAGPGPS